MRWSCGGVIMWECHHDPTCKEWPKCCDGTEIHKVCM